jgi:hypothetical protein
MSNNAHLNPFVVLKLDPPWNDGNFRCDEFNYVIGVRSLA